MHQLDEPIRKVTLNLYTEDIEILMEVYGRGWTGKIRDLVREHIEENRAQWQTQSTE